MSSAPDGRRWVHGDLHGGNVLIGEPGGGPALKVIDWGMSTAFPAHGPCLPVWSAAEGVTPRFL